MRKVQPMSETNSPEPRNRDGVALADKMPLYALGSALGLALLGTAALGVSHALSDDGSSQGPQASVASEEATSSPGATSGGTDSPTAVPSVSASSSPKASHATPWAKDSSKAKDGSSHRSHGKDVAARPSHGSSQGSAAAGAAGGSGAAAGIDGAYGAEHYRDSAQSYVSGGAGAGVGLHRGSGAVDAGGYFDPRDRTYMIVPGDTLSELAQRYGVSVDLLADYNGIVDPDLIYAYDTLRVPYLGR